MKTKVWLFNEKLLAECLQRAVAAGMPVASQAIIVKFLHEYVPNSEYPLIPVDEVTP